jgi:hypothetical protein
MDRDGNGNKIISCLKPTDFSLQVIVFKDGLVKGLFEVPASDRGKTIEILGNTQYNIRVTGGSFLEEFKPEYSPQCRSEIVAGGLSTCHISMRHKDLI